MGIRTSLIDLGIGKYYFLSSKNLSVRRFAIAFVTDDLLAGKLDHCKLRKNWLNVIKHPMSGVDLKIAAIKTANSITDIPHLVNLLEDNTTVEKLLDRKIEKRTHPLPRMSSFQINVVNDLVEPHYVLREEARNSLFRIIEDETQEISQGQRDMIIKQAHNTRFREAPYINQY